MKKSKSTISKSKKRKVSKANRRKIYRSKRYKRSLFKRKMGKKTKKRMRRKSRNIRDIQFMRGGSGTAAKKQRTRGKGDVTEAEMVVRPVAAAGAAMGAAGGVEPSEFANKHLYQFIHPESPLIKALSENLEIDFDFRTTDEYPTFEAWQKAVETMLKSILLSDEYISCLRNLRDAGHEKIKHYEIEVDKDLTSQQFLELFREVDRVDLRHVPGGAGGPPGGAHRGPPAPPPPPPPPPGGRGPPAPSPPPPPHEIHIFYIDCGVNDNDDAPTVMCKLMEFTKTTTDYNIIIYDCGRIERLEAVFRSIFEREGRTCTGSIKYFQGIGIEASIPADIEVLTFPETVSKLKIYVLAPPFDEKFGKVGGEPSFHTLARKFYERSNGGDRIYFSGENQFEAVMDFNVPKDYVDKYRACWEEGMEAEMLVQLKDPLVCGLLDLCNSGWSTGLGIQSNTRGSKKILTIDSRGENQCPGGRLYRSEGSRPEKYSALLENMRGKNVTFTLDQNVEDFGITIKNLFNMLSLLIKLEISAPEISGRLNFIHKTRPKHNDETLHIFHRIAEVTDVDLQGKTPLGNPITLKKGKDISDAVILYPALP